MRRYAFSGARSVSSGAQNTVVDVLEAITDGSEYTTGACVGIDAFVGRYLSQRKSGAVHRVVVPADRSRVDYWWVAGETGVLVEEMPFGSSYKDRNQRIVECSDVLVAFPAYSEDDLRSKRSGTWQTIRLARRAGLVVKIAVLG